MAPADRPGRFGVSDVAAVGKGTVSVVPAVSVTARDCATRAPLRTKLITGSPKPLFASPLPLIVNVVGGVARSIELGSRALTIGAGRVSVTVSVTLPSRLKLELPVAA